NDADVQAFLKKGIVPKKAAEIELPEGNLFKLGPISQNPITHIVAIDGGFQEVPVQPEFPSSTICFFQFGALFFSISDLEQINNQAFIEPDDMAKLKQIQRLKFTLPVRNFVLEGEATITNSVRRAVYDFFCQK